MSVRVSQKTGFVKEPLLLFFLFSSLWVRHLLWRVDELHVFNYYTFEIARQANSFVRSNSESQTGALPFNWLVKLSKLEHAVTIILYKYIYTHTPYPKGERFISAWKRLSITKYFIVCFFYNVEILYGNGAHGEIEKLEIWFAEHFYMSNKKDPPHKGSQKISGISIKN